MVRLLVPVLLAALVSLNLTACGSTAGWRFEIGVAPVTAIHNEATLSEGQKDGK